MGDPKKNKKRIKVSRSKFDFINCFAKGKYFLENNPINQQTQKDLEKLLYDKSIDVNKDNPHNLLALPTELRNKIFELLPSWEKYLNNLKVTFEDNKPIKNKKDFNKMTNIDKRRWVFLEIIDYLENKNYKLDRRYLWEKQDKLVESSICYL